MKNIFFGNNNCFNMLTYSVSSKHINHAYLISGDKGLGKKTFAQIFAQSILCTNTQGKPCGDCSNCINIKNNNHPDVCFLNFSKQASIGVDDIRNIIKDIYIKPNQSEYKIYVICNIEDITISGANALLKILEEPPKHGIFIITCQNPKAIPSTIVSRCVCLNLSPLNYQDYELALNNKVEILNQDIKKYFMFFQGNVGKTLNYLENNDAILDAVEFIKNISNQKEYDVLLQLSKYENDKSKIKNLFENSSIILRQILMFKLKQIQPEELINSEINHISNNLTLNQIVELIKLMIEKEYLFNGNFNLNLIINVISCDIKHILK